MATVDFTLDDLKRVFATKDEIRKIVKEEVAESEARIKTEIKHFVDVDHSELKGRMVRFGKAAVEIFSK